MVTHRGTHSCHLVRTQLSFLGSAQRELLPPVTAIVNPRASRHIGMPSWWVAKDRSSQRRSAHHPGWEERTLRPRRDIIRPKLTSRRTSALGRDMRGGTE